MEKCIKDELIKRTTGKLCEGVHGAENRLHTMLKYVKGLSIIII